MSMYQRYAEIRRAMRALEDEQKELNRAIMAELEENDADRIEFEYGKFTKSTKTTWKFTDRVATLEEEVKIAKEEEKEKGLAKAVESHYLLFTEPRKK